MSPAEARSLLVREWSPPRRYGNPADRAVIPPPAVAQHSGLLPHREENPVEEQLVVAVRLGAEQHFGRHQKQVAFADAGLDDLHTLIEVLLTPGPPAPERRVVVEPRHTVDTLVSGIGGELEHRIVVEKDVELLVEAVRERIRLID